MSTLNTETGGSGCVICELLLDCVFVRLRVLEDSNAGSVVDTENTGSDVDGKENVCKGIGEVIVKFYE
ncbi:hypothetical protein Tco_0090412 [Tanacetum coccineum]